MLAISFDPGNQVRLASRVSFERRLHSAGLRHGVLFRNPGLLLQALTSAGGPVVTFSGHVHRAAAVQIDPGTFSARSVPMATTVTEPRHVTLLTSPAAGQRVAVSQHHPAGDQPRSPLWCLFFATTAGCGHIPLPDCGGSAGEPGGR